MPLDHVGIAVNRLADALPLWEPLLGVRAAAVEDVPTQKVRVAFLEASNTHIELLEPTDPESAVGRFLASRGPGLHHLAFSVPSVDRALTEAAGQGRRLIDQVGRPGARGRRVGFVHPSGMGGSLVEFVEAP